LAALSGITAGKVKTYLMCWTVYGAYPRRSAAIGMPPSSYTNPVAAPVPRSPRMPGIARRRSA